MKPRAEKQTFTHADLVELGREWLIRPYAACADYGHAGCAVVITEIAASTWCGEPQPIKPPTMILAPSGMSFAASSGVIHFGICKPPVLINNDSFILSHRSQFVKLL